MKKIAVMLTFLLGIGLAVIESGFATKETTLRYRYLETSDASIGNPSSWEPIVGEPGQECSPTVIDLPCTVEFLSSEYADIDAFLQAHDTVAEIYNSDKVTSSKESMP